MKQVPVLIAGGGPVGMTLACELSRRGIACLLVERNPATTRHPKMDITNARSMELFRRLGVVDALRAVAVPESSNFDVSWITSLTGHELHRFRYPSVTDWRRLIADRNDGSMPCEPPMRVSQVEIEPVLQRAVQAAPMVEARWGVELEDVAQDEEGVTATLRTADGAAEQVRCRYLAGCDGGTSRVRQCLGIRLEGQSRVQQRFLTHFRSTDAELLQRWGIAWHYQSAAGTLIAQNDKDIWTLQTRWPQETPPEDVDIAGLLRGFAGRDFSHEILVANAWTPHFRGRRALQRGPCAAGRRCRASVRADRRLRHEHRDRRRLRSRLEACGGAARLLAARVCSRPTSGSAARSACATAMPRGATARSAPRSPPSIARPAISPRPAADAARGAAGLRIGAIGNAENESFGIELGYAYADSEVICADPGADIANDPLHYIPTTAPGARMPSVLLSDGTPIFDRLGLWFTLVCFGAAPSEALVGAAARRGVPLDVLRIDDPATVRVYGRGLLLIRPDQHIAWRGPACEHARAADAIVSRVAGFGDLA